MKWIKGTLGYWETDVPIQMFEGKEGKGNYLITITKRPHYCDRGDWLIFIFGRNDLDECDGFPRYFLGSEDEVKTQMETWLNRRSAYRKANEKHEGRNK